MNILILDDELVRHDHFEARLNDGSGIVYHTYTLSQFEATLPKHKWDWLFLDHDLSVSGPTGMDAIKLLVRSEEFNPTCIVHSWNPTAAPLMVDELTRKGFRVYRSMFSTKPQWPRLIMEAIESHWSRKAPADV